MSTVGTRRSSRLGDGEEHTPPSSATQGRGSWDTDPLTPIGQGGGLPLEGVNPHPVKP